MPDNIPVLDEQGLYKYDNLIKNHIDTHVEESFEEVSGTLDILINGGEWQPPVPETENPPEEVSVE